MRLTRLSVVDDEFTATIGDGMHLDLIRVSRYTGMGMEAHERPTEISFFSGRGGHEMAKDVAQALAKASELALMVDHGVEPLKAAEIVFGVTGVAAAYRKGDES
jgi:hypothetical protein